MKKVSLLMAAFALVLGFSQCSKKPVMPSYSGPVGDMILQDITLSATRGNGGGDSKVSVDNNNLKWDEEDVITVLDENKTELGELHFVKYGEKDGVEDKTSAVFESNGPIPCPKEGKLTFTVGTVGADKESFQNQTGEGKSLYLTGEAKCGNPGNYSAEMKADGYALLKLNLSYFAPSPSKADVTVNISVKAEDKKPISPIASVKCASDRLGEVYVAVPANENKTTYTFSDGSRTVEMSWDKPLVGNTFFTADGTGGAVVIEPAAPTTPTFTVAAGTTVEFAPGNLYWDGSSWKFEANQWDFRTYADKNSCINGAYSTTGTPSGHWGLFGWSTVASSNNWGMHTRTSHTTGYTNGNFKDWGKNAVGSDAANTWRTLSRAEWNYLLGYDPVKGQQTDTYGRPGAKNLCAWKELDSGAHKGLVILPDGTKNPSTVMGSITSTSDLATYGAVFLPAAGYRSGTDMVGVGAHGLYWSSTPLEGYESGAYYMTFRSDNVNTDGNYRYIGHAVRLVR